MTGGAALAGTRCPQQSSLRLGGALYDDWLSPHEERVCIVKVQVTVSQALASGWLSPQ
jgi:hypothetical protein